MSAVLFGVRCGCHGVDQSEEGADLGSKIASEVIDLDTKSQDFGGLLCWNHPLILNR